jgi:hypothetical protein
MTAETEQTVIDQTRKWIKEVVIGCNFCPFAAREIKRNSVVFHVVMKATDHSALEKLAQSFEQLDRDTDTETIIIIFPDAFSDFFNYLDLHAVSEALLAELNYEGVYQIATFHPEYLFSGTETDDPANYTNRSPYPMLHILRESSVSKAVDSVPDADQIPLNNIAFAKQKGLHFMQALKESCKNLP